MGNPSSPRNLAIQWPVLHPAFDTRPEIPGSDAVGIGTLAGCPLTRRSRPRPVPVPPSAARPTGPGTTASPSPRSSTKGSSRTSASPARPGCSSCRWRTARVDDHLYLHGAVGNAMLKGLATGTDVCVTVTIVDELVLSRSAFHHSMNYRSVVVVGEAQSVSDQEELRCALRAIVDHSVPGRSDECRGPSPSEVAPDACDQAADHRGVGQGAHRSADRGSGGSRDALLGWRAAGADHARHADRRRVRSGHGSRPATSA